MKRYDYLNLNQKMIKIRKKIPALIKKRYSEDVDYDFVKIDDIYELLTPALNKYGVDFEILGESSTQNDTNGNPIFLKEINGSWRYEADLELCWINADSPEDKKTTSLHVIGTHEIPEKAKGTAWTYGLKYYLLNRFSIKQGGFEDPDMVNNHPRTEQTTKESSAEKASSKTGSNNEMGRETKREKIQDAKKTQATVSSPKDSKEVAARNGNAPSASKQGTKSEIKSVNNVQDGLKDSEAKEQSLLSASPKEEEMPERSEELIEKESAQTKFQVSGQDPKETGNQLVTDETEAEQSIIPSETGQETEAYTDGFHAVDSEEVPFFEDEEQTGEREFMENLREDIKNDNTEGEIENARKVRCDFGLYSGKTLGEMLESPKGRESVKWIAQRYRGANTKMKDAAKLLVDLQDIERHAA